MMKKLMLLGLVLVLFGCSTDYGGLKINKKITASQIAKCEDMAFSRALKNKKDRKLYDSYDKAPMPLYKWKYYSDKGYDRYIYLLGRISDYEDKCYYDLGYRLYPLIK